MSNAILEQIHKSLGNLLQDCNIIQIYVDEDDPWSGILAAAESSINSTTNRLKFYNSGQLIFGRDMIIGIKHKLY